MPKKYVSIKTKKRAALFWITLLFTVAIISDQYQRDPSNTDEIEIAPGSALALASSQVQHEHKVVLQRAKAERCVMWWTGFACVLLAIYMIYSMAEEIERARDKILGLNMAE